ncbi:MFS transporter [Kibdelosporangium aridum]|uniref:MFS transporter n=1 Tax=Kibdelosporangium aridum TaxID=2030 RepID=UPI000AC845CF|nr:MFS transporter [Kibdelosporangium aridum]
MDRLTLGIASGGLASFALLYAPQPVLPQLADEFQITPGHASLAVGVATGALAIAVIPLSLLSEVVGRRPVILTSVVAAALIGLSLPLVHDFRLLLVLRALQGVALAGFPAVAMAYLAEQGRLKAIGMLVAGNTFGGMVGRLLAGLFGTYRGGVGLVAIFATIATGVLIWALPKRTEPVRRTTRGLRSAVSQPLLWALYGIAFLGMGSFVAMYNAIGFRLAAPPLELSPQVASLVFLAYAVGGVSSATLGSQSNLRKVLFGMLGLTIVGTVVTIPTHVVPIAIGFVLLTAGWFAAHAAAGAWVNVAAPNKGPASGLYSGAYYAGACVGGTIGTMIYAAWGWSALVLSSVSWLSAGALGVWLAFRRNTRSSAKNLSRNTGAPLAR